MYFSVLRRHLYTVFTVSFKVSSVRSSCLMTFSQSH